MCICYPLGDPFSRHLNSAIQEVKLGGRDLKGQSIVGGREELSPVVASVQTVALMAKELVASSRKEDKKLTKLLNLQV